MVAEEARCSLIILAKPAVQVVAGYGIGSICRQVAELLDRGMMVVQVWFPMSRAVAVAEKENRGINPRVFQIQHMVLLLVAMVVPDGLIRILVQKSIMRAEVAGPEAIRVLLFHPLPVVWVEAAMAEQIKEQVLIRLQQLALQIPVVVVAEQEIMGLPVRTAAPAS